MENINFTIGTASVTYGGVKVPHAADAFTFTAEPILQQIDLYTAPNYDQRVEGWKVEGKLVVDEDSLDAYKMALAGVEMLEDPLFGTDPDAKQYTGLTDGVGFKSLRSTAKELVIHPDSLPASDKSLDVTIFMAASVGSFERVYGKEKTSYEITFTGLHKTGDSTKAGNYFRIGEDFTGA